MTIKCIQEDQYFFKVKLHMFCPPEGSVAVNVNRQAMMFSMTIHKQYAFGFINVKKNKPSKMKKINKPVRLN